MCSTRAVLEDSHGLPRNRRAAYRVLTQHGRHGDIICTEQQGVFGETANDPATNKRVSAYIAEVAKMKRKRKALGGGDA